MILVFNLFLLPLLVAARLSHNSPLNKNLGSSRVLQSGSTTTTSTSTDSTDPKKEEPKKHEVNIKVFIMSDERKDLDISRNKFRTKYDTIALVNNTIPS